MTAVRDKEWLQEFGIEESSANFFEDPTDFASKDKPVPQAHVVRRAFDLLDLDGVLCDQDVPLVYFKLVKKMEPEDIMERHHKFWNHGGAPLLAFISEDEVQIYTGFARPTGQLDSTGRSSGFVDSFKRASTQLREFLPTVETGEFFHKHSRSFDPTQRVDHALLDNLEVTREKLFGVDAKKATTEVLEAFLCRLVFTCYLFDREIIGNSYLAKLGFPAFHHLRDVLTLKPRSQAKASLYRLFHQLARDFNGDLFSDDLNAEAALLSVAHLDVVEDFFHARDVNTGQGYFWLYDFGIIPIETVSAIYERFLKPEDKEEGAFYTPRFLAELILDIALKDRSSLLNLRFLDPACGSGIFLVGLFNRMAEEWKQANPRARNDRRAQELKKLLLSNIFGIDKSSTACRVTAFSLYLAYLDQLSPRDIQELQAKGHALPRLVTHLDQGVLPQKSGGLWCGDFFGEHGQYPSDVDLVIGNPPWGDLAKKGTAAAQWCAQQQRSVPNYQIAAAFMWKAAQHVSPAGKICLLLPHGILFNHNGPALIFQKEFIKQHALEYVLNLVDYQRFLFSEAEHPALVLKYRKEPPNHGHTFNYWIPKVDWKVIKAEVISVSEYERKTLTIQSILRDLDGRDAPQIWKRMMWSTSRDQRLLERLADIPRLEDRVSQIRDDVTDKPWIIAVGFQPPGPSDNPEHTTELELPSNLFICAKSRKLNLFLLEEDCDQFPSNKVWVRGKSNKNIEVFHAPHIVISKGFGKIAFANFAVSFHEVLRGIYGPPSDRQLLMFLAAYMRSPLAQYFMFHTSSNWGVSRKEIHVEEILRLPFPLPDTLPYAERAEQIVKEVSLLMDSATKEARIFSIDREALVKETQNKIDSLIYEYFDVIPSERILIEDTIKFTIPSFRPSLNRKSIKTIELIPPEEGEKYKARLCETLNAWARNTRYKVVGLIITSPEMGVGLVVLEKIENGASVVPYVGNDDILAILEQIRAAATVKTNTLELLRGVKYFQDNRLFIVKPLQRRYWTETAALNDADEIAYSILMDPSGEDR